MGKYYKTNTVPIVDYSIKYPFRELMQAEMYKQKRGDMAMDVLDKKRQDLIDFKATPGQTITNADGTTTYQQSPDEQVLDTKRAEYNSFVEGMRGKDLAKNYSAIRQGINGLYDPALADIKKSREAYDLEQADIAAMDKKGEWDSFGWTDPAGWDTATQGVYKGSAKPFFNYRPNAEKIFDKAVADTYIDPVTGLLREELSPEKLKRLAQKGADSFMADPKNHRAIDKHLAQMDPAQQKDWETRYGKEGAKKRAAEQMLYDVGMEKYESQVTMPKKNDKTGSTSSSSGTTKTKDIPSGMDFPSTLLVQGLMTNNGVANVPLANQSALLSAHESKDNPGTFLLRGSELTSGDNQIILGAANKEGGGVYFDYDAKNGVAIQRTEGESSSFLDRKISKADILYEDEQRRLKTSFDAELAAGVSMEEYTAGREKLEELKREEAKLEAKVSAQQGLGYTPPGKGGKGSGAKYTAISQDSLVAKRKEIAELEASQEQASKDYERLLRKYRGQGLLDPESDESKAKAKAYKEYLDNQGGNTLSAGQRRLMTGNKVYGQMDLPFTPSRTDNVVTIGGKMYMSGTVRLNAEQQKQLAGGEGWEDPVSGDVIEGESANPNWWGWGIPGTTNISQALVSAGLAKEHEVLNAEGDGYESVLEINTYVPVDFDGATRQAYDKSGNMTHKNYVDGQAANNMAVDNLITLNKQRQSTKRVTDYNKATKTSKERTLLGLANNLSKEGVQTEDSLRRMTNRSEDGANRAFKYKTDKGLLTETVQEWRDYLAKADKQDWGSVDFMSKNIEPSLKVLEDFIANPGDINKGGKDSVATAIQNLSGMYPVLLDPMGAMTAGKFGMTEEEATTVDDLQRQNYHVYKKELMKQELPDLVTEMNIGKTSSGLLPSAALDEYKSIGADVAKMNKMTKITSTNTKLAINDNSTYVPYVAPGFVETLKSIADLKLGALEISGALRMPAYEKDLGVTSQSGAFISGRGVSFSLETEEQKKAAAALKMAIKEGGWGQYADTSGITVPAGYYLTFKEAGTPPMLHVTLEEE